MKKTKITTKNTKIFNYLKAKDSKDSKDSYKILWKVWKPFCLFLACVLDFHAVSYYTDIRSFILQLHANLHAITKESLLKKLFSLNSAFLLVKLLSVAYTARDTYNLSHDLLAVALIDAMFFALWLVVAYGKSDRLMRVRPFATIGACILYAFIVLIGLEAHTDLQATVAIACRVGIAIMLLHDAWDYAKQVQAQLQRVDLHTTLQTHMQHEDEKADRSAYTAASRKLNTKELQEAWNAVHKKRLEQRTRFVDTNADTNAGIARDVTPANAYTSRRSVREHALDASGRAVCNLCNWVSTDAANAGHAYSAHTRSRMHIALQLQLQMQPELQEIAVVDATPEE